MKVKIGIIGLGNVGSSVIDLFYKNKNIISQKSGCEIELSIVCDKDYTKKKLLKNNIVFTTNYEDVVNNPDVDIVVELIGGDDVAYKIITTAIQKGKHIVTANKALLAKHWDRIFTLCEKYKKVVYFESAVGAGIPVIQSLNEGLAANKIVSITGILNGTTNYILSTMTLLNQQFDLALKKAQKLGFAEKDPSEDIKGYDTAYKLSILSSIAYSRWVKLSDVYIEGIENIELQDIRFAESFGYAIKLLGCAKIYKEGFLFEVRKYLVPKNHIFANIINENNGIMIEGDYSGKIMFIGRGAGGEAASSAVMSDIIYVSRGIVNNTIGKIPYITYCPQDKVVTIDRLKVKSCFYIRFITVDRPGVLAKIANVLGKYNISIAAVYQKEPLEKFRSGVPIVMLTHKVAEGNLISAMKKIEQLDVVLQKPVYIKIYE